MKWAKDKFSWQLGIILSFILQLRTRTVQTTDVPSSLSAPSFSSENFIVRFNPFVALEDESDAYDEADMVKMVGLIATKFSSILAPRISARDVNSSLALVATSVAKFNRMHESTLSKPLEVFMPFGDKGKRKARTGTSLNSFDLVLDVAERANLVFPGTVKYLLVKPNDFKETMTELLTAEYKLLGMEGYKLGGLFPLNECLMGGASVTDHLRPLLGHLDLAVFIQAEDRPGVNTSVSVLTGQFEHCQGIIHSLHPDVKVGFLTSHPDTDYDGRRDVPKFIQFWREINNWAMTTHTKLFMLEAFDIPIRSGTDSTKGWWKLTTKGPPHDVYKDKLGNRVKVRSSRDGRAMSRPPPPTNTNNDPSSINSEPGGGTNILTIVLIVVGASILSVSLTAGAMYFLWWRVSSKTGNDPPHVYVSDAELVEFFEGFRTSEAAAATGEREPRRGSVAMITSNLNSFAYNMDYELDKSSFTICKDSILGSGEFGIVCRGRIHLEGEEEVQVAVKTSRSDGDTTTGFKGMLVEAKLHSRLGKHPNVVNLLGAYTAELRKGLVFIFTEFCENGSLDNYLKSFPVMCPVESIENCVGRNILPDGKQFYKWSYQIACGMEYLTNKKVVHADLATRNVLLTAGRIAKISDFGLSRRLHDYANYVETQQGPMPWPWMAPESLRRMEFNEKTDVWAYGITLWEIYSMGDRPYPGLAWTVDLPSQLENGLRPDKPKYDLDNMYEVIMLQCWDMEPERRPSFLELKRSLILEFRSCCVYMNFP